MRKLLTALAASVPAIVASASAVSPYQVVDSNGKVVGLLIAQNTVAIKIKGVLTAVGVSNSGLRAIASLSNQYLLYTSTDCSGQAYIEATDLPTASFVDDYVNPTTPPTNYIPGRPLTSQTIASALLPGTSSGATTTCYSGSGLPFTELVGTADVVDFTSLGFTPPFKIK